MLYKKSLLLIFFCFLFTACQNSKCLKSIGELQKVHKELTTFKSIKVEDNISLILTEGEEVYLEAGENLIPYINFEVVDSSLVISNKNSCDWLRSYDVPVKVYAGSKNLSYIAWRSYGKLSTEQNVSINTLQIDIFDVIASVDIDINSNYLLLFTNSGTSINLKGKTNWLSIFTMGYGKIDAKNLSAKEATIKHQGQNDIETTTEQKLSVDIESSGNLIYFGKPQELVIRIIGSGTVIAK
ncbi:MAG: head GIN domain-containing protein [Thermonemataceae bacterium]|nr:head GIN domain-containing protein [Thermonemataceae bacterium]